MLENPGIPESFIASCVQTEYGLVALDTTFLPLGYDVNTAVYRFNSPDTSAYFLKLRKGAFDPITVAVPEYLTSLGNRAILPPHKSLGGKLYASCDDYTFVIYPFITGKNGYQAVLRERHWITLGRCLRMVHEACIPPDLDVLVQRETYDPQWRESVKRFLSLVEKKTFDDPVAEKLSSFIKDQRFVISHMVERADELAGLLKHQESEAVLCHSDAHPGNYLVADTGELYLVDWDNPIFAPKERDLMFFGSGMTGIPPGGNEEGWFYQGYGWVEVDRAALAYYRFERIIQDIAEFCKQIFLTNAGGEDRLQSYQYVVSSFSPGKEVESAMKTDWLLGNY